MTEVKEHCRVSRFAMRASEPDLPGCTILVSPAKAGAQDGTLPRLDSCFPTTADRGSTTMSAGSSTTSSTVLTRPSSSPGGPTHNRFNKPPQAERYSENDYSSKLRGEHPLQQLHSGNFAIISAFRNFCSQLYSERRERYRRPSGVECHAKAAMRRGRRAYSPNRTVLMMALTLASARCGRECEVRNWPCWFNRA